MIVDEVTAERIGLQRLRAWLAPVGAFGRAHDAARPPYQAADAEAARDEIAAVVALSGALDRDGVGRIRSALRAVPEPGPIVSRARAGDPLSDVDFYELGRFADALTALGRAWDAAGGASAGRPPQPGGLRTILAPGRDGSGSFYLADAFDPALAPARATFAAAEAELAQRRAAIAVDVRAITGVDAGGDDIVVLRDVYDGPAPEGTRIVRETPTYRVLGIVAFSAARDRALADLADAEEAARRALAEHIGAQAVELRAMTDALGALDRLLARVAFTQRWGGCVPQIAEDRVQFADATFAPLAEALTARGHRYTPLSLDLHGAAVLTGPNMGGKSAALATTGFLCACVALGVPPPARSAALPPLDRITWIGGEVAADRTRLLSSYAGEVVRARDALAAASPRALILADEFARTTGPREGRALLVAFVDALRGCRALALIATHFDNVPAAADVGHLRIAGLRGSLPAAASDDLDAALDAINAAMDYRVVDGTDGADASDALALAALLGMDARVVERAQREFSAD
jgi:hypothetical protein